MHDDYRQGRFFNVLAFGYLICKVRIEHTTHGAVEMVYATYTAGCEVLSQFPLNDSYNIMIIHLKHESCDKPKASPGLTCRAGMWKARDSLVSDIMMQITLQALLRIQN